MKKIRKKVELVLPSDAAACDACIERVLEKLRSAPGVEQAHVDHGEPDRTWLCFHYDPSKTTEDDLNQRITEAGAGLQTPYEHFAKEVVGLKHERHAKVVEALLAKLPGVAHAAVAFGTGRVSVEFDPRVSSRVAILETLASVDISVKPAHSKSKGEDEHDHSHAGPLGQHSELLFSLVCGVLVGVGWGLTKAQIATAPIVLFALSYAIGGWYPLKEVWIALRARKFEIDLLMIVAAAGAAGIGKWAEGGMLLFLFTLGHALEGFAMRRARRAIEGLASLVPDTAVRLDAADKEEEVSVDSLQLGDRIRVKPNTRIPADGVITSGESSVNQAPVTGESVPVDKRATPTPIADKVADEHRVFAGTINGAGVLVIAVTRIAADSTLARVVKMVAEAENQKSATQLLTDRFERIFVPAILGIVGLLLFAWVVIDEPFATSLYRALSVLVAASPCALAIATPSAVLSGVARAARGGVLIKGGAHLEALGGVDVIAFDKTGTLTIGKPSLTDVSPVGDKRRELLLTALAVEQHSDHPLASAVVEGARAELGADVVVPSAENVQSVTGYGITANVNGIAVQIGKPALWKSLPAEIETMTEQLRANGRTVMIVQAGEAFLGVLGMMDTLRANAREVVAKLGQIGVERTVMLSGDNQRVAEAVAKEAGIATAQGDLLPTDKVAAIARLAQGSKGVAMVGDGVNDAPALAAATVGIAMGAGGSDVALDTADVALMADDLSALPFAIGLSRAARSIIRQNLWASLGMVAFLIPATILGFAGIGVAVILHEGSTLLVVANALRLLAHRDPRTQGKL